MSLGKLIKSKQLDVDTEAEARLLKEKEDYNKRMKELAKFEKISIGIMDAIVVLSEKEEILTVKGRVKLFSTKDCNDYRLQANKNKTLEQIFIDAYPTCREEIGEFIQRLIDNDLVVEAKYQHDGAGIESWTEFFLVL